MTISTDYASPVTVNGFACRNCTDMARAEKNIDPANPSAGPFGVNKPKSEELADTDKSLFERDKIEAAIAARQQSVERTQDAAANSGYGAAQNNAAAGQLVSLRA